MGKPAIKRHSFFKVMIGDFETHLRIPPAFKKKHLINLRNKSLLRGPCGRIWRVRVCERDGHCFFQNGWATFVADHAIASGDFIVFSYEGCGRFNVKIYGRSGCEKEVLGGDANGEHIGCSALVDEFSNVEKEMALEAARSFKTPNPHFIRIYKDSQYYHLKIPQVFAKRYFLGKESMILQDSVGRSWPVKVSCLNSGRVEFSKGWSCFCKESCLREGDVCVFELFQEGNVVQVHIFRVKEATEGLVAKSGAEPTAQLVRKSGGSVQSNRRSMTGDGRKSVLEVANSFKTKHPKFVTLWKRWKKNCLAIPPSLVRNHDLKTKRSTIVHDPYGRSWPVNFSEWKDGRVVFGSGWPNFVRENHLRDGDICVFEIHEGAYTIQVHIFRAGDTCFSSGEGVLQ